MGKYFCDYCDVFLTHDSASVRRAHNAGRNHLTNVKDYYSSLGHDKAQDLIDQITKMYESGAVPNRPFPNAPTGMAGSFAGGPPPMGMSGPPGMPGMNGMNGLPGRPPFGGPQGFNPQQPGGFPGAPGGNFPGPPLHFGQGPPPQFFNNGGPPPPMGMAPPPGFRPPPGMPLPPPGFFGPPGGSPMASGPMSGPPPQAQNAPKLVNGYSAERAKLLGLI